jgi:hypothetical protein
MRMKLEEVGVPVRPRRGAPIACRIALPAFCISLLWTAPARAQLIVCDQGVDAIAAAVARVRRSVDPCGESPEIEKVLTTVERCARNIYEVCADVGIARNVFDRPMSQRGRTPARTITWNPELRTELESTCSSDRSQPLQRDPTASLLHELVHAAQDCEGLNPGEHELEAVRIENIYRRAAGLCERSGYGDELLPPSMRASCSPRACLCSSPVDDAPAPELPATTIAQSTDASTGGEGMDGIAVQTSGDRPAR